MKTVSSRDCETAYDVSREHQRGTLRYHTKCVCTFSDSWKSCWQGNNMSATDLKGSFTRGNLRADLPINCARLFYFDCIMWLLWAWEIFFLELYCEIWKAVAYSSILECWQYFLCNTFQCLAFRNFSQHVV